MESVAQLVAGMYVALPVIVAIKFHHLHKSEIFRLQEENLAELLQNLARENTLVGGTFFCLKLCKPLTGEAKSGKKRAISLCGESIMTKVGHEYFFGNAQCVSPSSPLAITVSAGDALCVGSKGFGPDGLQIDDGRPKDNGQITDKNHLTISGQRIDYFQLTDYMI